MMRAMLLSGRTLGPIMGIVAFLLISKVAESTDTGTGQTLSKEKLNAVKVVGKISLPPMLGLHILGRRVAVPARHAGPKDLSKEEIAKIEKEMKKWQETLPSNTVSDNPIQDHVHKMNVRAVPIPFDAGPGIIDGKQAGKKKDEIQLILPIFEGKLKPDYFDLVVSFSGRVELRYSLRTSDLVKSLQQGKDTLHVDLNLKSTVESAFFRELGQIHEIDQDFKDSVQKVVAQVSSLMLTKGYGRQSLRKLVRKELLSFNDRNDKPPEDSSETNEDKNLRATTTGSTNERKPRSLILTPANACNSASPAAICYDAADEVVYNLIDVNDIYAGTTMGVNLDVIRFNTYPSTILTNQYFPAQQVAFSWYTAGGASYAPSSGVAEEMTGYAKLDFTTIHSVLRIQFPANILSFGFKLVDGDDFNNPVQAYPRRSFRVTMFDAAGNEIHQYRWYVAHSQGFYGATLGATFGNYGIRYIEISVEAAGYLAISDLHFSSVNVATAAISGRRATGGALTLNENLGWRAVGNWKRDTSIPKPYTHPWKGDSMRSGDSGGTFWKVEYDIGTKPNVLMSPAFTLSNLPVWNDKDDDYSKWNIGFAAATGAPPTELSQVRIPGTGYFGSCTCTSSTSFNGWCCFFDSSSTATMDTWTFSESIAAMHSHWSHAHFSSYAGIDPPFVQSNDPGKTERWVEYSVDNGHTWKKLYWYEDESHRGRHNTWWNWCHMHAFTDSDLSVEVYGDDHNGDTSATGVWTDFDKDGSQDYVAFDDWDLDGTITNDREWDTEFYLSHIPNPASTANPALCTITRTTMTGSKSYQFCISDLEAPSIMYRFRFVGQGFPNCPNYCKRFLFSDCGRCKGWAVDDVSFSNDDPDQGYYTNFDGSYDSSFA